ncbi:uncharacterized protein [Asterias amurensis]|uniref:uncharacterized protein n=1 Tax=Asterias amurensis TaxID=7602 RepID=UPI003AB561CF
MPWCNVLAVTIVIVATTFASSKVLSSTDVTLTTVGNETTAVCDQKHSCDRMGCTAGSKRLCQCDNLCPFFDDCCHDYNRSCTQEPLDNFSGFAKSNLSCVGETIGDILSWQLGYWMVASCPDTFDNLDVVTQCQTLISDSMVSRIPVTDTASGTLYRNVHCGICNGINLTMLTAWTVQIVQCKPRINISNLILKGTSTEEKLLILDTYCQSKVHPPRLSNQFPAPRPCFPNLQASCSTPELQIEFGAGCASYTAVVQNRNLFYKNPHCFKCSLDTNKEDSINCSQDIPFYIKTYQRGTRIGGNLVPLSIIMDFGSENTMKIMTRRTILQEEKMTCPPRQVYNPDTVLCQPLICHAGFKLEDRGCVVDIDNKSATWCNNTMQEVTLTITTADCVDGVEMAKTAQCVRERLAEVVNDTENWMVDGYDVDCLDHTIQLLSFCSSDDATLLKLTQIHSLQHPILNDIMVDCDVRKLTFTQNHAGTINCHTQQFKQFSIKDGLVEIHLGNSSSHYNLRDANIITEYTLMSRASNKLTTLEVCVNASALASCSMVKLNASSFTLHSDNSIVYLPTGKQYGPNDYLNHSNGILVCSTFESNYTLFNNVTFFSYSNTQVILSTTGSILSLVACALTFFTYCVFPTLRNRTSKAIMSLVVALFISQTLLLFSGLATSLSELCGVLAVMAHYFWLTAFCWMNVLSLDLFQTFGSRARLQRLHSDATTVLLYMLYAWGSPLLVVIPCIAVHFCRCTSFQYGNKDACWIKDGLTNLLAFGLPVAILLIINIILYCKTVAGIRTTKKDAAGMQVTTKEISETKKKVQELLIYIKIGSLMGFTWVFSFAAAFSHLEALWYFVIILNSLQGVFIFFSFMCNERVYKLWCKKLSREGGRDERGKLKRGQSDEAGTQSTSLILKKTNTIKERLGSKSLLETKKVHEKSSE